MTDDERDASGDELLAKAGRKALHAAEHHRWVAACMPWLMTGTVALMLAMGWLAATKLPGNQVAYWTNMLVSMAVLLALLWVKLKAESKQRDELWKLAEAVARQPLRYGAVRITQVRPRIVPPLVWEDEDGNWYHGSTKELLAHLADQHTGRADVSLSE